jgi:hypothetical protein
MDDHLSPEGNLAAVLNMDPEALLAGTGTDHYSCLFEQGVLSRPHPRKRRDETALEFVERAENETGGGARRLPTPKERREVAEALDVLRAVATQAAQGVPNGYLRLKLSEKRVLDALLARPVTWETAVSGSLPEPDLEGGAGEGHWDDEGRLPVRLRRSPSRRSRFPFEFLLSFAADTLAEIILSGRGERIGVCQAPAKRSRPYSRKKCGSFWVHGAGRPREGTCSDACYQRAQHRKESLKKARRADRKRREREQRLTGKGPRLPSQL